MSTLEIATQTDLKVLTQSFDNKFQELLNAITSEKSSQLNEEKFLTKEETAKLLSCSISTVNRRVKQGTLNAYKIKGYTDKTAVRFKKSEVLNLFTPSSCDTFK